MEQSKNKMRSFDLGKMIRSNAMPFNLGLTIAAVIVNCLLLYIMLSINSYSAFSKTVFIVINIIILLLMLGLNAVVFYFIKTRQIRLFQIGTVFLVILLIISAPGAFITMKVNKNVNKVINTSGTQTQSVTTSIVVYGSDIADVDALNGKMLGIVPDTTYATKASEQLSEKEVQVTNVEFDSFSTLLLALVGGEVDAAALPGNYQTMYANEAGLEDKIDNFHSLLDFESVVKNDVKDSSGKDLTTEPFSVLILGNADGNTDAIIVASFNPVSMRLTMTSIARDSWVPICGKGSNKINAAYAYGGVSCVMKTVEDLLDIEIDFYFMANFKGVVEIVDAIGGIVVNNPYEFVGQDSSTERGHKTVWIPAGENVPLNGEQALAFARERKLYASGDFQRQRNQQQVISAILTKALRVRDLNTMLKMLDAAGDNIETNISTDQLIDLFNYVIKKVDRWKYSDEHPERVIDIVGSRVTGYNSSVWSDAAGVALSIVVPYEGSIADNRAAFLRNMWQDKTTKQLRSMVLDASYEYTTPTVSNETYSEAIKQSDTPPSYWCSITGGTYESGTCACPVGTQFISEKGCQEVQTDFTKLTDEASCIAGSGKWSYDTNTCYSACPSGYVESTYGYCSVNTCSKDNPKGCLDEVACKASGNEWKDNYCTAPQVCDASHLNRCDNESACTAAGGSWDGSTCGQPKSNEQKACEASGSGGTWKDGKCVCNDSNQQWNASSGKCEVKTENKCSTSNLNACKDEASCKALGTDKYVWDSSSKTCKAKSSQQLACEAASSGGKWDAAANKCNCPSGTTVQSDGSCKVNQTSKPENTCSAENPGGCKDQTSCEKVGKYWYNNTCNANPQPQQPTCSKDNLSACTSESVCSGAGLNWWDGACHIESKPVPEVSPEQKCRNEGKVWYNGACHASMSDACISNGLVEHNGTCISAEEKACYNKNGTWVNGSCVVPSPDTELPSEAKGCMNTGGSWDASNNVCHCLDGYTWDGTGCVIASNDSQTGETPSIAMSFFANKPSKRISAPMSYRNIDFSMIKRINF